jgi:alginate O-acetyltransferase complex protein AlgI
MLFNSLEFALFFPIVCALFFMAPKSMRLPMLLVASCVFYMFFVPQYILILFVTILIDYVCGLKIEASQGPRRRSLLVFSIVATCAVLFVFKYFDFFMGNFVGLAGLFGWKVSLGASNILLPIGLSFHTFQSLSYVVEVYYGRQKAEPDFIKYSTFVMFFPQLVAGPIERPQNLLHQFSELKEFNATDACIGLRRMAWGFFKKLVVADRLAIYVNDVYGAPQQCTGLQLTLATVFFAYQIYCDFSGYSDIALGTARVLGFNLMENFNTPYWSLSVGEFWKRWHISLSTWFKDYVYVPLGGSRVDRVRWARNVLITFGISGLWHGANWTYVFWGFLNGLYLVCGALTLPLRDRLFGGVGLGRDTLARKAIMLLTTFFLTCIAWVLFRAKSMSDAHYILTHLAVNWDLGAVATEHFLLRQLPVAILSILLLEIGQLLRGALWFDRLWVRLPLVPRWACYLTFFYSVVFFGVYRKAEFIYFQF